MSGGAGLSPAAPPVPLTGLVGREREIAELGRMVTEYRLVTVIGPGGGGKTRLAIAAATTDAGRALDGVCWVERAPLGDPALVAQAVAAALGVRELRCSPAGRAPPCPSSAPCARPWTGATGCSTNPNAPCGTRAGSVAARSTSSKT